MSGGLPPAGSGAAGLLLSVFVLLVVTLLAARLCSLRSPALHASLKRRASRMPWGAVQAGAAWRVSQQGGAR